MTLPEPGERLRGAPVAADPERMKVFSLVTRDPNPIHWDLDEVDRLGLGDRVVNQGALNLAYVLDAVASWPEHAQRVRSVRVRFLGNVFAGDLVTPEAEATSTQGDEARLDVRLVTADGTVVLAGTATTTAETADRTE